MAQKWCADSKVLAYIYIYKITHILLVVQQKRSAAFELCHPWQMTSHMLTDRFLHCVLSTLLFTACPWQ